MIDRAHVLAVTRQCALLGVDCSTVYYRRQAISEMDPIPIRRLEALQYATAPYGPPEIGNTDPGRQFKGLAVGRRARRPRAHNQQGGRRRWMDNIFMGRLGRNIKI